MRIIGGRYRGRTVTCPPGVIRPAMDKMKESVFASLGDLTGRSFLDLFSGSGSIGIEAASRGADPVVLVERDRKKYATVRANMSFVETGITLIGAPAERYLLRAPRPFDIIFLDPPFDYAFKRDILKKASVSAAVGNRTLVLIHYPSSEKLPDAVGALQRSDLRVYGGSTVAWYRAPSGETE